MFNLNKDYILDKYMLIIFLIYPQLNRIIYDTKNLDNDSGSTVHVISRYKKTVDLMYKEQYN